MKRAYIAHLKLCDRWCDVNTFEQMGRDKNVPYQLKEFLDNLLAIKYHFKI